MGRTLLSAAFDFDLCGYCKDPGTARGLKRSQFKINFKGVGQECPTHTGLNPHKQPTQAYDPHRSIQVTSIFSFTSFLSFSSLPVSSNELVSTALPFSTLVITYEQLNQCASARSVCDHWAG